MSISDITGKRFRIKKIKGKDENMDIQKIKKIEKKIVAIATVDKKNKPHNIAIQINKIQGDKIILTDNYMKLTVENIKNNPNVSLVFWHGKEGAEKLKRH